MKNWVKKLHKSFSSNNELQHTRAASISPLENKLGYRFKNPKLLEASMTHPSFMKDEPTLNINNQRLEFLGDSVLSLILAEKLFELFPDEREGILAKSRAALAKGSFLSKLGRKLHLADHLRMSRHEANTGGPQRASTLEDALEAVIGAIYLDSDYPTTRDVVLPWYGAIDKVLAQTLEHENPKGKLQEQVQGESHQSTIEYNVLDTTGPDHKRTFTVAVLINGERKGEGQGNSKKEAEESAARSALERL